MLTQPTRLLAPLALVAFLGIAGSSSAAVRHASPSGSGTSCIASAPCTLEQALDAAGVSDEIVVHGGTHEVGSAGALDKQDLDVHGAASEARPEVRVQDPACGLSIGQGSRIADLRVRLLADGAAGVCASGGATVERVSIDSANLASTGVRLSSPSGALVRSVSVTLPYGGSDGIVASGIQGLQVRNVSVWAQAHALRLADAPASSGVGIRNSYLRGDVSDIHATCASTMTIDLARNAFSTIQDQLTHCTITESAPSIPDSVTDVSYDDGVLRPTSGSALLDAGASDAHAGDADVDGDPRSMHGKPDIGADEHRVPPKILSTGASQVTATGARLSSLIDGLGAGIESAEFEYGTTTGYGEIVTGADPPSGARKRSIVDFFDGRVAQVEGLEPGTTYHFRTRLTNEFGQETVGPDAQFTTAAAPVGEQPAEPAETPGGPVGGEATPPAATQPSGGPTADRTAPSCRLRLVRARRRGRSVLSGRCSEAAVLRITIRGRRLAAVKVPAGAFRRTLRTRALRPGRSVVRITARDTAGNAAAPLRLALRRRG
jgi:hypothetical protein